MSRLFQNIIADFADDKVIIDGNEYPVGSFVVNLLNQGEAVRESCEDDLIAMNTLLLPAVGITNEDALPLIGIALGFLMQKFRLLEPFSHFFTPEQEKTVHGFFCDEATHQLFAAHNAVQKASGQNPGADLRYLHKEHPVLDNAGFAFLFSETERRVRNLCDFMVRLLSDVHPAYKELKNAAEFYSYRGVHNETVLLQHARTLALQDAVNCAWEYVDMPKGEKEITVAKRYYFKSYREFIITDFFEGLHHNHYPRQCIVCKRFFLVTNGRWKEICDGDSGIPIPHTNRTYTCRQFAKRTKQKETTDENPIKALYDRRMDGIRHDVQRAVITETFAACAKQLAKERKQRALIDHEYANGTYLTDIEKPKLYADVEKQLTVCGGTGK